MLTGVDGSFAVIYTRETGATVVEAFQLGPDGRAKAVQAYYHMVACIPLPAPAACRARARPACLGPGRAAC